MFKKKTVLVYRRIKKQLKKSDYLNKVVTFLDTIYCVQNNYNITSKLVFNIWKIFSFTHILNSSEQYKIIF